MAEWTAAEEGWMRAALVEAKLALDAWEVPVGCVIVRDGAVVATGSNAPNETRNATRHAELEAIDALLAAHGGCPTAARFPDCTLVVTCEPCIQCAAALALLRFRAVLFGCANDRFGGCGSVLDVAGGGVAPCGGTTQLPVPLPARGGLHAAEAVALLKAFYLRGNPSAPKPHRELRLDLDTRGLGQVEAE